LHYLCPSKHPEQCSAAPTEQGCHGGSEVVAFLNKGKQLCYDVDRFINVKKHPIMTKTDSYANERIGFYEARFASETIHQLVQNFNNLAVSRGWTAERSCYSAALIRELERRGIDLTAIVGNDTGLPTIRYIHVAYDEVNHALLPIA